MRKVCVSREHLADAIVDLARRGEVVADRLLQHHARLRRDQAGAAEIAADRTVEVGRGGEIEHAHPLRIEQAVAAPLQSASGLVASRRT